MPTPEPHNSPIEVEVFRAGDYGEKGHWPEEVLDEVAADYNPRTHEAPVTLDHDQRGPAQGWVAGLRRVGDRLVALVTRVSPHLRELLASGAYKHRSIELYRRFAATGRPYLKALSFLGAAPPHVKGLADPAFADASNDETLTFDEQRTPPPTPPASAAARERLVAARRWNPAWEDAGLPAVFDALGEGPLLNALLGVLESAEAPVSFAEHSRTEMNATDDSLGGAASDASVRRHREALALQAREPALSYAEALLRLRD